MAKNSLLVTFFLAVQAVGIAMAFLGYHYLQLVNEYRERNFQHIQLVQDALDIIAANYFPTEAQLSEIAEDIWIAQSQVIWCTDNLNRAEIALFDRIGAGPLMVLCRTDVETAGEALETLNEMQELAKQPDRFGSEYLSLKAQLESRINVMKQHSSAFQPFVNKIEASVGTVVRAGTVITGVLLTLLILQVSLMMTRLFKRLAAQNTELEQINRRFDLSLNSVRDGFALYDHDLKLLICNETYRRLSSLEPHKVKLGMHVSDVLRQGALSGMYPEIDPSNNQQIEEYVAGRMQMLNSPQTATKDFELANDLHVRVSQTNSALGDKVIVRTDVSDYVRANRTQQEHAEQLRKANAEVRHKSLHDPLTDLPNRRLLDRELEKALNNGLVTLIRIDLDRFKQVNDVLGHKAGDFVLQKVADTLRAEIREGDLPSRFGGDEFVVLCRPGTDEDEARALAQRMLDAIVRPLEFEGKPCRFGASFGIASSSIGQRDGGELLSFADAALYAAKDAGRRTIEVFSPALHEKHIEERLLGDEFATALETGQIVPYFQTQHDAGTHQICGAEVLARWEHPRRGVLSPPAFLDVVRKLGMEGQLDAAIFDRSVDILEELTQLGLPLPRTSFNVSAGRLLQPEFLATASASLRGNGEPSFAFEILESISLEDMDEVFSFTIQELRDLGFEIEIDDFGSGHASIASVMDIAPHALKIDRRLVAPLQETGRSMQMIASIVQLAKAMDIRVTAEGVETEQQARLLLELGCDTLQGYLFSYPEPASDLRDRLKAAQENRMISGG